MSLFNIQRQDLSKVLLKDKYGANPFSILRADTGEWIKRKRYWESILKDRENNIRDTVAKGNTPYINNFESLDFKGAKSPGAGMISTFDPFLCELMIKWFSQEGDTILDPFAGGIVRGGVASFLNRAYIGIDISAKQIEHNESRWSEISQKYTIKYAPSYKLCDSNEYLDNVMGAFSVDMVLTCPPYYNLERYTDMPEDLSNSKSYNAFINSYKEILCKCAQLLKSGGYMVLVVEEIRDKDGNMYGFVPDTVKVCQNAGLKYYNELILMNPIASLGIRSTKYFEASRKVGRHHQNVLVFKKH